MKNKTLLSMIGAGIITLATIGGTIYEVRRINDSNPNFNGVEDVAKVPGLIGNAIGESVEESIGELGKDYQKNPEKYRGLIEIKENSQYSEAKK